MVNTVANSNSYLFILRALPAGAAELSDSVIKDQAADTSTLKTIPPRHRLVIAAPAPSCICVIDSYLMPAQL